MKAIYIAEPGGPEKLVFGDRPDPKAGPGEVVVRVGGTALNHADLSIRAGRSSTGGLPRILGLDMAGEVAGLGPGVTGWRAGDRVVVENRVKCGTCTPCVLGRDEFCERQKRLGGELPKGSSCIRRRASSKRFDLEMREFIMRRVKETAETIAKSGGAEAEVQWGAAGVFPVINDVALTQRMGPTLRRVAGADKVVEARRATAAEDFSFFAREIPGFYFFLGVVPPSVPIEAAAPNHSPRFVVDESGLLVGVQSLVHLTVDYMKGTGK